MNERNSSEAGKLWQGIWRWYREQEAHELALAAMVVLFILFLTFEFLLPMGNTGASAAVMIGVTVFVLAALPW